MKVERIEVPIRHDVRITLNYAEAQTITDALRRFAFGGLSIVDEQRAIHDLWHELKQYVRESEDKP